MEAVFFVNESTGAVVSRNVYNTPAPEDITSPSGLLLYRIADEGLAEAPIERLAATVEGGQVTAIMDPGAPPSYTIDLALLVDGQVQAGGTYLAQAGDAAGVQMRITVDEPLNGAHTLPVLMDGVERATQATFVAGVASLPVPLATAHIYELGPEVLMPYLTTQVPGVEFKINGNLKVAVAE